MKERNITLATQLFCLAEDFNRAEYHNEAFNLKMVFRDYMNKLTKKEQKEVNEYLESVGA